MDLKWKFSEGELVQLPRCYMQDAIAAEAADPNDPNEWLCEKKLRLDIGAY